MTKVTGCRYNWAGCRVVIEHVEGYGEYVYLVTVRSLNGTVYGTMAKSLKEAMKEGEKNACLIHPELSPQASLCQETQSLSKVS